MLTVKFDESVGFTQWILCHAFVWSEILWWQFPNLQYHVLVVPAVRGYGLIFFAWNRHIYFCSFLHNSVISLLTRDNHVTLFGCPKIYRRRKRFSVTLQLDVLTNIATYQLIWNSQHWRNCNEIVKY